MIIQNEIKDFMDRIKFKYPALYVDYSYDIEEDYYHIWHTNSYLQYEDDDFLDFVGSLIRECFYSKGIFNFSFGYNYLEHEKSQYFIEIKSKFHNIMPNIGKTSETQEAIYYHLIKHCESFNWSNFGSINILDATDLSFCKSIRQAQLLRTVTEDYNNQPEEALVA